MGLTVVTMEMFTTHKYITLQEYEDHIQTMAEQLGFTEGKVWKVLVCANLAVLLIDVAEMSALWEETSPEGRTLMIDDIALRFPKQFMTLDEYRGQSEAKVLLELRTQALVQVFLDSIPTDLAGWNTITMIDNVLRVNSPPDEEDIQGNKVRLPKAYLFVGPREIPPAGSASSHTGIQNQVTRLIVANIAHAGRC